MRKGSKCCTVLFMFALMIALLTACGKQETQTGSIYYVYYLNKAETKVVTQEYEAIHKKEETQALIDELLDRLQTVPESIEEREPINTAITLLDYQFTDGQLILNFDENYRMMPPTTEVLVRAAMVRTMTQIEGVQFVSITVRSEPLTDMLGNVVGAMTADMFIDNAGNEINAYEKVRLHLYFANADGTKLVPVTRDVVYNSNISLEKLVIEETIKGPTEEEVKLYDVYPVISPETKLVTVTVKDGISYVNFDNTFLTQTYNVTSDVTLYAFANALVELSNVNKMQISINGETDIMYRESTSLTTVFERNLEIVDS
ncbi:MAG: GerMN domain-containing protein [Lachnospiraceae bacterium]|nr:GerMN domain-containing protein [Lachnospiraceae bacterium]